MDTTWYTGKKTEYILTSADQLMGFQYLRTQKVTFDGITIKLGCDMIINDGAYEEFLARGEQNYAWSALDSKILFLGTFDGQGHTVKGVYMQLTSSGVRGMFGGVGDKAVIKNFTLENCYFGGPSVDKKTLGCLVAKVNTGATVVISNVDIYNVTMQQCDGSLSQIGGFVGLVEADAKLTISNCEFQGNINFGTKGTRVGGFVGAIAGGATVTMTNCVSKAVIQAAAVSDLFVGYTESSATVTKENCTSN